MTSSSTPAGGRPRFNRRTVRRSPAHRDLEELTGVRSPAVERGECHFCGMELPRSGQCPECV